jgi:uncharacterized membrane protein YdbT with pleckstrin-like domain
MAEETVWTGRSSQWKNFSVFLFCLIIAAAITAAAIVVPAGPLLLVLLVLPGAWAFWRWLRVRCRVYRLTNERLIVESGILSKTTETLELYRVRDLQVSQPFTLRLVGLQNLQLITTDTSTPQVVLDAIPTAENLADRFRESIEQCRVKKGVREIDIE